MTNDVKYDEHYRSDPAACGAPFAEFVRFCEEAAPGAVLDLGCGQGRDALMFARAGHRVVGVDVSRVGVEQMLATAQAEGLSVEGVVANITNYEATQRFDVVILDRVLHMLTAVASAATLTLAMEAVEAGGHLLIAEGAKGMTPIRERLALCGWSFVYAKPNRLIAKRPL